MSSTMLLKDCIEIMEAVLSNEKRRKQALAMSLGSIGNVIEMLSKIDDKYVLIQRVHEYPKKEGVK